MEIHEVDKRLEKCIAAFMERTREHLDVMLGQSFCAARDECESPIERIFLTAWLVKLEEYVAFGSPFGGRATITLWHKGDISVGDNGAAIHDIPDDQLRVRGRAGGVGYEGDHVQHDVICCQSRVGEYRADFFLRRVIQDPHLGEYKTPALIVECDGHDYHERTKEQAAHDRARDRSMLTSGIQVMRFTGYELFRDPLKCVEQVDDHFNALCKDEMARRRKNAKN